MADDDPSVLWDGRPREKLQSRTTVITPPPPPGSTFIVGGLATFGVVKCSDSDEPDAVL